MLGRTPFRDLRRGTLIRIEGVPSKVRREKSILAEVICLYRRSSCCPTKDNLDLRHGISVPLLDMAQPGTAFVRIYIE